MPVDLEVGRSPGGVRMFPLAFRIEFVRRWHTCTERGAKARLLRELNLDYGTINRWLKAYDQGEYTSQMVAASEKSRNRVSNRERAELARLRSENDALKKKVAQAEAVQEILGKAYELLHGINESSSDPDEQIPPALMSADEYAQWLQRKNLS
ncbi:hypothetical protein [Hoyosella subflava]|uniref:Transposase n=1 Tax=Hoyosella subflava (strain DSM 45089 / JCM 17490 / NBRC 109087 / DQS3-9A1) TaxID=443218 RepID=F6EHR3_HOYSD|nr:hypothetical protein [Hoyosella subflava]AEF38861.1 hypothetical protein AS9A_0402 [Hoyosella subflava DQS3-9A1]